MQLPFIIPTQQDTAIPSGGNGWANGSNVSGWANAFATIFGAVKGNSQPDTVNNYIQQPTPETTSYGWVKWVIGGLVVFVIILFGIIMIRTSK